MKNYEENKNEDAIFFNSIIFGNRKIKKETKAEKREKALLTLISGFI